MPATSILLVDSDRPTAEAIAEVLRSHGHSVALAHDYKTARARLPGRRLVILGGTARRTRSHELCREIRGDPATAIIPVLAIVAPEAAEERVRWFDSGADDVLVRPFDERELEARVQALLVRYERSHQLQAPHEPVDSRRVVTFVGAKGGVGTTTAAVNVARAIAELRPDAVAIVDLDLQRGQVGTHLNVSATGTVAELALDAEAFRDPEIFGQYIERHPSGLRVLLAPTEPDTDHALSADQVRSIVGQLRARYEVVILDAGSRIEPATLAAVELADEVVFVFAGDMASLKALRTLVRGLGRWGAAVSRTTFVLNHVHAQDLLKRSEIEATIGARIAFDLPYDSTLYQLAVNHGVPLLRGAPESEPANAFRELGALLLQARTATRTESEPDGRTPGRRRRLAEILKR